MADNIIIKKVKKGHHGHHGGAWKIAYADFVTAMMAFFLLMWLLETTTKYQRQGVAEYFNTSIEEAFKGGSGHDKGQAIPTPGEAKPETPKSPADLEKAKEKLEKMEKEQLEALKKRIEEAIDANPSLKQFKNQLLLDITSEGLRIQIVDEKNRAMFEMAKIDLMPYTRTILREIGNTLNDVPNRIGLSGHTDASAFGNNDRGYSNWELSTERANAARRELILGGLESDKVLRVVGLAAAVPLDKDNPLNPINRRISIVVMNKHTEQAIIQESGAELNVQGAAQLKKGLAPAEQGEKAEKTEHDEPGKHGE